jgi:hypothetical protein
MLRNAFGAWHTLQDEMQKEANKLSCEEAAFKLGRRNKRLSRNAASSKLAERNNFTLNSKGGKN